jgi:hypothetical protein
MDWTLIIQATAAGVAGLAVIALALAVIVLARHNRGLRADIRRLVDRDTALIETAGQQVAAVQALAEETHQDHTIAIQPLLVLLDEPPIGIREQPWAAVRIRNVGNGPALYFVVWMLAGRGLYRSAGAEVQGFSGALHLASRDIFEPGPLQNMLYVGQQHGYLDPGSAVVGEHPQANLVAYCGDQFGNRYRFNLRTADPPEVWEQGTDAPLWAGAWDPRLSSGAWSPTPTLLTPVPERDATQLVEALHEKLHALQDAAAGESDVNITGRAGTSSEAH